MVSAFARILRISIVLMLFAAALVYILRQVSFSQTYIPFDHPVMNENFLLIADRAGHEEWPANSLRAINECHRLSPDLFVLLDIERTPDGTWLLGTSSVPLADLLSQTEHRKFVLNIQAPYVSDFKAIESWIQENKLNYSVIVTSPHQATVRELRKAHPDWAFGLDRTHRAQLLMYTSLFVEPLVTIGADFVFADRDFNPRLLAELKRRHKRIYWQAPKGGTVEIESVKAQFDGILTGRPSCLFAPCTNR